MSYWRSILDICGGEYAMKDINNYQVTNNPPNCDMPLTHGFGKQEGWICPVCGRGVAPWVDYCPCQIDKNITWATGTDTGTYTKPRWTVWNDG